jgi:hypothetical protein
MSLQEPVALEICNSSLGTRIRPIADFRCAPKQSLKMQF